MSTEDYGSIATEDAPLIARTDGGDVEEDASPLTDDNVEVGVYNNNSNNGNNKKSYQRLFVFCATLAVVACFVAGPVSPFSAAQGKAGGPWGPPTGAGGAPFDWKAYGASIKKYWADKKAAWHASKADMIANNVTAVEYKGSKSMFWNTSTDGFADVLNITQAAERQQKAAAAKKAAKKKEP